MNDGASLEKEEKVFNAQMWGCSQVVLESYESIKKRLLMNDPKINLNQYEKSYFNN